MSTPTIQRIQDHAEDHHRLIKSIRELKSAPDELERQSGYVEDLLKHLKAARDSISGTKRRKESEEGATIAAKAKRLIFRKYPKERESPNNESEERDLLDNLESQLRDQHNLKVLETMTEEAICIKDTLCSKTEELTVTREKLYMLYEEIFAEPTPGQYLLRRTADIVTYTSLAEFSHHDVLRECLNLAQDSYDNVQSQILRTLEALNTLVKAEEKLEDCVRKIESALSACCGSGLRFFNEQGREDLETASALAVEAHTFLHETRAVCPDVPAFGPISVKDHPLLHENYLFSDASVYEQSSDTMCHIKVLLTGIKEAIRDEYQSAAQRYDRTNSLRSSISKEIVAQCHSDLACHRSYIIEQVLTLNELLADSSSPNSCLPTSSPPGLVSPPAPPGLEEDSSPFDDPPSLISPSLLASSLPPTPPMSPPPPPPRRQPPSDSPSVQLSPLSANVDPMSQPSQCGCSPSSLCHSADLDSDDMSMRPPSYHTCEYYRRSIIQNIHEGVQAEC
ncbi:hypothetical protein VNI00_007684 [Paramarasmius palmivorus]|uniref:Uncharacterized protein n=1 Tax=Paramarasmius palmivorus TaxID=297713 RepID=A0AAW0CZT4_9AGAR